MSKTKLDSSWLFLTLQKNKGQEQCRTNIPHTIVYEEGETIWLHTDEKTGRVVKRKGSVEKEYVEEFYLKTSLSNIQNSGHKIATIHNKDGGFKILNETGFRDYVKTFPGGDAGMAAMQIYTVSNGNEGTIYRSCFKVVSEKARVVMTTKTFSSFSRGSGEEGESCIYVNCQGKNRAMVRVTAESIIKKLNIQTREIVGFLERNCSMRVLEVSLDYAIDITGKVWLLWASSPLTVIKGKARFDLRNVKDLPVQQTFGRSSWLGLDNGKEDGTAPGENHKPLNAAERKMSVGVRSIKQIEGASNLIETYGADNHNNNNNNNNNSNSNNSNNNYNNNDNNNMMIIENNNNEENNKIIQQSMLAQVTGPKASRVFPNAFTCIGDYCNLVVQDPELLAAGDPPTGTDLDNEYTFVMAMASAVLTKRELALLVRINKLEELVQIPGKTKQKDPKEYSTVTYKSILESRNEKRGITTDPKIVDVPLPGNERRPLKDLIPTGDELGMFEKAIVPKEETKDGDDELNKKRRNNSDSKLPGYQRTTEARDINTGWKELRGDVEGGAVNYYDHVRVCHKCFQAYALLDKTRDILVKEGFAANSQLGGNMSDQLVTKKKKKKKKKPFEEPPPEPLVVDPSERGWKKRMDGDRDIRRNIESKKVSLKESIGGYGKLDDYLRGKSTLQATAAKKKREKLKKTQAVKEGLLTLSEEDKQNQIYHAKVLVGDTDEESLAMITEVLEGDGFQVTTETNGREMSQLATSDQFDCVVMDRDLPAHDAFKIVKNIREYEKAKRAHMTPPQLKAFKSLPVICFTFHTAPEDLKKYMEAGMDGCISKPLLDEFSLTNTIRLAVPKHLSIIQEDGSFKKEVPKDPKVLYSGCWGDDDGTGSSYKVAKGMSLPSHMSEPDGSVSGAIQIDAQTKLPYTILDGFLASDNMRNEGKGNFYNLVICHDFFDTQERLKIILKSVSQKYPGLQILLWNYPGQAFTEFRDDCVMNNEYYAACLEDLLLQVGKDGTREFDTTKPFHILGFGNGASVATYYAAYYNNPTLRSLMLVNGASYVDANLAGILHDSMNVFACSPPTRPDLPVYFFSRFLFSPDYLRKVSTPLALNLYTAVHNPITVKGRIQICSGALKNIDLRPVLKEIDVPIINVQSTQGVISKSIHVEPYVRRRAGEVRSINKVLKEKCKTCVIWVKSGHEVFQEIRKEMTTLIEQMCIGYHENNEIAFLQTTSVDPNFTLNENFSSDSQDKVKVGTVGNIHKSENGASKKNFDDGFIDSVITTMKDVNAMKDPNDEGKSKGGAGGTGTQDAEDLDATQLHGFSLEQMQNGANTWDKFSSNAQKTSALVANTSESAIDYMEKLKQKKEEEMRRQAGYVGKAVLNPDQPAFERQDNVVYKAGLGSVVYPSPVEYPEVKEYMKWRLKRNHKRLQRLDKSAKMIQGAFRGFMARKLVKSMKENRAAIFIQRVYRGWRGRLKFLERLRLVWAAQIVQRNYRGHAGRKWYAQMRKQRACIYHIQRIWRGKLARERVKKLVKKRHDAAVMFQSLWRKRQARKAAFLAKHQRNCAINIQRLYRGHLGRRRAGIERDKYVFSKTQSQGIEFGRQMLLEHKLHATRLQSEVSLLTQEKIGSEEETEALLEEISEFEEGVNMLEKEMHQLSKVETEAAGVLDEDARQELREQKMRLDREFGEMLVKIADRKERLQMLEEKLASIDKTRQVKEEELRNLERKLVILLEEQQNELDNIRRRQKKKGEVLLKTQEALNGGDLDEIETNNAEGGGGFTGPSHKEKRQAAQLMQSTETLMKFGFMSMSMTYFSSLNMIRAMRTVSCQDTVMAAVASNTFHQQKNGGGGGSGGSADVGGGMQLHEVEEKYGEEAFKPALKPGQLPGQQPLKVSAWSVEDVANWLMTLCLGQYREAFMDAAVDGPFLYDLNDDDLKNTLGMEHKLHRKKLLGTVNRLKAAESARDRQLTLKYMGGDGSEVTAQIQNQQQPTGAQGAAPAQPTAVVQQQAAPSQSNMGGGGQMDFGVNTGPVKQPGQGDTYADQLGLGADMKDLVPTKPNVDIEEIMSWVRHSKGKKIREALKDMPNRRFDVTIVVEPYVEFFGTTYLEAYEREAFNLNKTDEFGNTMLHIAAQNGNDRIANLLIEKGANPNHQNKQGQTPGHYGVAYKFFEFVAWLYDPDKGGADDTVLNKFGLTAYDGLSNESDSDSDY